jgi:hypothetical protein
LEPAGDVEDGIDISQSVIEVEVVNEAAPGMSG